MSYVVENSLLWKSAKNAANGELLQPGEVKKTKMRQTIPEETNPMTQVLGQII